MNPPSEPPADEPLDLDKQAVERKRITASLSGPTLVAFSKRLEAEPDMSADRLACLLIGQAFEVQPESPVASEIKVLNAHLQGIKAMLSDLGANQAKALEPAFAPLALKVDTVRQCLTDLASKPLGPAELSPDQAQALKDLTVTIKNLEKQVATPTGGKGLRLAVVVSSILIGLAGWAAFRPAPAAKVDLSPLQGELRAIRQDVEARPDLGPKVAELAKRIDVQDKAFVAVMDRLQPPKKP